ncbi:MAG: hypothetical protein ABIJ12_08795 [bacterium]
MLFIEGCSTNYQGPLRFSSISPGQNYQNAYNGYKSSNRQITKSIDYKVDTLIVIDTIVEECPLEVIERSYQEEEYESCPVIFDTITTGDHMAEAEFILRDYLIDLLPGSVFYKKYISELIDQCAVYLPDILDYILELLGLDKIIEKQRYPEVYLYLSSYHLTGKDKLVQSYSEIQRTNYFYDQYNDINYLSSERSPSLTSEEPEAKRGLDIVQ